MIGVHTIRLLGVLLVAAALSGCAAQMLPLTSISEIEHSGGQTGGDPYTFLRSEGSDVPQKRGSQIVEVRAFMKKLRSDDKLAPAVELTGEIESTDTTELTDEIEISGADCVLKGDLFSAKVVTPAGVRVPLYGRRTADLSIECSKEGFEPGTVVVKTYNKTTARKRNNMAGGGLLGVLIGEILISATNRTNDIFEYLFTPVMIKNIPELDS